MGSYVIPAGHVGMYNKALVANTVDTVTFTGLDVPEVEIVSDGTADIFVMFGASSVPTVNGTDCWLVPAAAGSSILSPRTSGDTVVKLISSGTPTYSVARAG